ncbi:uncharacterized protein LOC135339483 [Halichondria panicea]|uniref:uncharacterized protein LOC135339483 n=1 Tax=Halichondria panicea TaxID=6063 RepID=UPI00312B82F7
MMPGSKIVLPSSNVDDYTAIDLHSTVSRILNPTNAKGGKEIYKSENCPSWWPNDVLFSPVLVPVVHLRKILAAFLEKCPEQYTILSLVDQQNSASAVETDQPEDPAVGTRMTKMVLPSSDAEEYSGNILRDTFSRIVNPKGLKSVSFHSSENCPSWWPKDVAFCILSGPKATMNGITAEHQKKVLAAFLEKCPEQYTISPGKLLLNPPSSPLVGDNQPVREVSPQSSSESDQEEPVGMNQTPPTGTNRTRSVGATISTAAQHASPKLILPSSCANYYDQPALILLIRKILNPLQLQGRKFTYFHANCPSWWPTDVPFIKAEDMKSEIRRKVLTAFMKKCPDQYTISPPVDEQNSASTVETDQPEDPAVGTKRATMMSACSKIVLPSSNAEEYSTIIIRGIISRIVNPKGWVSRNIYASDNRPSWWPKDVAFTSPTGPKAVANGITTAPLRKVLAAFFEKCPEQYTISPPVDQQNSSSTVETDQPEFPAVGRKRPRIMPGSKIVLPSSNVYEYSGNILQSLISRIANSKGVILFSYSLNSEFLVGWTGRNVYTSGNRPSWWPKDVAFASMTGRRSIATAIHQRKVLAAFLEKCPEQYTISPPVDQQNSASTVETDQPEYPAVGTKRPRIMPGSKIVLPSSDVYEYSGNILQSLMSRIANSKGWTGRNVYTSGNRPSWWPKDVAFASMTGHRPIATAIHQRKVLAAFLEKCPERYTISPGAWLLNPTSSPLVGDKQPVREVVSPQSFSESDQEEPVGMNQTPPTGANRTQSVGATISTAAQHASLKLILPSSCANDYSQPSLISLIRKILNPQRRHFIYSSANCPSWWPTDIPFIRAEDMEAKDRTKVLTAFLEKCPDQYTISPAVDQQNSASIVETYQSEDTIVDVQMNANESDVESDASIPSDPEDLVNSLEQHLLDSRKRRLEAERKVEELTEEVKHLREERKYIGSIVKRSRLHH